MKRCMVILILEHTFQKNYPICLRIFGIYVDGCYYSFLYLLLRKSNLIKQKDMKTLSLSKQMNSYTDVSKKIIELVCVRISDHK
jgi:hypothetical protein